VIYLYAFLCGGALCAIAQILIDKTKLTPARILVIFVTAGVILTGLGIYEHVVDFGKSGATVPICGFGYTLATGVMEEVDSIGFLGIFTGGIKATAAGVCAAVFFSFIAALITRAHAKN
jgi:stage V sporulation protein AE